MPDELFEKAAKGQTWTSDETAQNRAQSAVETHLLSGKEMDESEATSEETGDIQQQTAMCDALPCQADSDIMETKGFEPSTFALRTRRSPS